MNPSLSVHLAFVSIVSVFAGQLSATPVTQAIEQTPTYSLEINSEGHPSPAYFPIGFNTGLKDLVVQTGFNIYPGAFGLGDYLNNPPPELPDINAVDDGNKLLYYTRPAPGNILSGRLLALQKKEVGLAYQSSRFGALPPAINAPDAPSYARRYINFVNIFDPNTRRYLIDYSADSARIGSVSIPYRPSGASTYLWGMDNEWENQPDYSPQARAAFLPWLEKTYAGDIAGLNEAWRTQYPSFADAVRDIRLPTAEAYAKNPGCFLDYWQFQTEAFTRLLADIGAAIHEADPAHRGVAHKSTQQTVEMPEVNRIRTFDHALFAELMRPVSGGYYGFNAYGNGDRQVYETNFVNSGIQPLDRSLVPGTGRPYGVFYGEANNHDGPGHQFASTYWRVLANGLKGSSFFTTGFAGATADWDKFGFVSAATGAPKSKLFYAARWASMLHRSERFWTDSVPLAGLPRVALLVPHRDILLSPRDPAHGSKWAYAQNNRLHVFTWLREQGYWVDVIPETKLNVGYLSAYQALFLVGAEHLTDAECDAIRGYVGAGGTLVADTHPGRYDEHHRPRAERLTGLLGIDYPPQPDVPENPTKGATLRFHFQDFVFTALGSRVTAPASAKAIAKDESGAPIAFLHDSGQGRVLTFPFELGTLTADRSRADIYKKAFVPAGPTADSGEVRAYEGEFVFGKWLSSLLAQSGLEPAYEAAAGWSEDFARLRVESPVGDARGNVAIVIANRAFGDQEVLPPQAVLLPPFGLKQMTALWAAAENNALQTLPVRFAADGRIAIALPSISSAGVLYLFSANPPLLGVASDQAGRQAKDFANDGHTLRARPGLAIPLRIQLFNTTGAPLPEGTLRGIVPEGWRLSSESVETPPLGVGEGREFGITITPVTNEAALRADWLYPAVFRWRSGDKDQAVIATHFLGSPAPEKALQLLTDNAQYPKTYPHRIATGATYHYTYPAPESIHDPVRPSARWSEGTALTNGYAYGGRSGTRLDTLADTGVYARYDTARVVVEFDLKSTRTIRKALLVIRPTSIQPTAIRILTSDTGSTVPRPRWALQAEVPLRALNHEIESPLFSARARYVRIEMEWTGPGGALSEVELWGN